MGGYYIPKSQRQGAQPSGFETFMQQFLQGYAIGQQRRQQQMAEQAFQQDQAERQQQMEFHKLNLSKIKAELALEQMLQPLKMAGALQGQPGGSMSAPPPQIFSPSGVVEAPGEAAPMAMQDAGPSRSIPLPHPEFNYDFSGVGGPSGSIRPQTAEQVRQQTLEDMIRKQIFETNEQVRAAGLKTRAEEDARRAPMTFSLPGLGETTVPGSVADEVVTGAMTGMNQRASQAATASEGRLNRANSLSIANRNLEASKNERKAGREDKLLDDYNREVKDFATMDDQLEKVREFAKDSTGATDMGLIYSYMKMLDPGSTVREGEYATAQNSGSVPERVRGAYNKALRGERLDSKVRADFVAAAERAHKAVQPRRDQVTNRYRVRARTLGVDENLFGEQSNAPVRIQSDAEYNALPSGATFIAPDGTTRRKP